MGCRDPLIHRVSVWPLRSAQDTTALTPNIEIGTMARERGHVYLPAVTRCNLTFIRDEGRASGSGPVMASSPMVGGSANYLAPTLGARRRRRRPERQSADTQADHWALYPTAMLRDSDDTG